MKDPNRIRSSGMKIATLQFAPKLGSVSGNIRRANQLLGLDPNWSLGNSDDSGAKIQDNCDWANRVIELDGVRKGDIENLKPDVLVLPELAFTG